MKTQNPPNKSQPRPPTLHLDHHRAWRQSENAVIIPIVYDFLDPVREAARCNALYIPIASTTPEPLPLSSPVQVSRPVLRTDETMAARERQQTLPAVEENHLALARVAVLVPNQPHPDSVFFVSSRPSFSPAHHLSTAVPLLLLGGIALVVFAWMAFR